MVWNGCECGKRYGNENPKATAPVQIMIYLKQPENVEYFNYLGSIITNNARYTREIKCSIAMAKAAFNKKKTFH